MKLLFIILTILILAGCCEHREREITKKAYEDARFQLRVEQNIKDNCSALAKCLKAKRSLVTDSNSTCIIYRKTNFIGLNVGWVENILRGCQLRDSLK